MIHVKLSKYIIWTHQAFENWNCSWYRHTKMQTVLLIETVLSFTMSKRLPLYWSYNRDILDTIQTVLIMETWEYLPTFLLVFELARAPIDSLCIHGQNWVGFC